MVFKELEIQGFKSFPDKVKIRFDEGVTGVVGPNGSGKSNLSDAVRWVLGETSSRQVRPAGKMEAMRPPPPASCARQARWRTSSSAAPAAGDPWALPWCA